jgi:curved DNA-binding protein CbpA
VSNQDHYSTLGVLPDAEDIVINAAYRALAQRYHPDKWKGEPAESHRRMSSINVAYHTLGDEKLRADYDRSRTQKSQQDFSSEETPDYSEAFTSALNEVEERWSLACSIFPDLKALRAGLSKISTSLAFAYVTGLLGSKIYEKRHDLAAHLELNFLQRYFGTDEQIIKFAKELILLGKRDAAKALNSLVDVMGSEVDASLLISRIEKDFSFMKDQQRAAMGRTEKNTSEQLVYAVRNLGYYKEARQLAELLGYRTAEVGGGFFSSPSVTVKPPYGEALSFKDSVAFVEWVKNTLCSNP